MALVSCAKLGDALVSWLNSATQTQKDDLCAAMSCTDSGSLISGVNEQVNTAYTMVASDATQAVRVDNASPITVTVPQGVLPLYATIPIIQGGAGGITLAGASGVTLEAPNGLTTTADGDFRTLFQRAPDIWVVG